MSHFVPHQDKEFDAMAINSDDAHSDILRSNSPFSVARKRRNSNKNKNGLQQNLVPNQNINEISPSPTSSSSNADSIEMQMMEPLETENKSNAMSPSQRSVHGSTKTSHAFWNLCKCYVGAASFALPWAVSKTGLIPSISGFIFLSSLAWLTFRWMLISSHYTLKNCNPTYPELAQIAFSKLFPLFGRSKAPHENESNAVNGSNLFIEMQNDQNEETTEEEQQRFIEKQLYDLQTNKYNKVLRYI